MIIILVGLTLGLIVLIAALKKKNRCIAGLSTELKNAEDKLKEVTVLHDQLIKEAAERKRTEDFLSQVLESVEPLVVIGKDYKILSANRAYCRHIGRPVEEIIGKNCYEVSHNQHEPCAEAGESCSLKNAFETGKPCVAIHQHQKQDGAAYFVEVKTFPVKNDQNQVISIIEILSDITERRRIEVELATRVEELERFTGLFIDRELKMMELKEKIKELEKKINE